MFSRFTLIRPSRLIPALLGLQLLLWIVLFPEEPTIRYGEPKCHDVSAYLMFVIMFGALMLGVLIGERRKLRLIPIFPKTEELRANRLFRVGKWVFWPAFISFAIQFRIFIQEPGRVVDAVVESSAINVTAAEMRDNTIFGVASFSTLLMVTVVCMGLARHSPLLNWRKRRSARRYLMLSGVLALLMSTLGMARQFFLLYVVVLLCVWALGKKRVSRVRIVSTLLLCAGLFWAQTLSRQGSVIARRDKAPILSWYVQQRMYEELVEAYTPAEFNRALIALTYPAHPEENFLYGTAFERFHVGHDPEGRNLNTLNVFGIWYWQFGRSSVLLAFGVGYWLGRTFRAAQEQRFRFDVNTCRLLLALAGVYTMVRDNFVFLQFFFVPLIFLSLYDFLCRASDSKSSIGRTAINLRSSGPAIEQRRRQGAVEAGV
jgi:hypothetical protein